MSIVTFPYPNGTPMTDLKKPRDFTPLTIAVLTVSDTRTLETDKSGDRLVEMLTADRHILGDRKILPDERALIADQLRTWSADPQIQIILTTGGTGVTGRDVTPEAVRDVVDFEIPGFGELFRWQSYQTIGASTIQSRAMAGRAGECLIFALPGSSGAVKDAWEGILRSQLDSRTIPCNFATLLPRLGEV